MKPREKKPETVFRIINRTTGEAEGSYSRAFCDEYDFGSAEEARTANVHGMFKDPRKYAIAQYRVIYELVNPDVHLSTEAAQIAELQIAELEVLYNDPYAKARAADIDEKIATALRNAVDALLLRGKT